MPLRLPEVLQNIASMQGGKCIARLCWRVNTSDKQSIKCTHTFNHPQSSTELCAGAHGNCSAERFYADPESVPEEEKAAFMRAHGVIETLERAFRSAARQLGTDFLRFTQGSWRPETSENFNVIFEVDGAGKSHMVIRHHGKALSVESGRREIVGYEDRSILSAMAESGKIVGVLTPAAWPPASPSHSTTPQAMRLLHNSDSDEVPACLQLSFRDNPTLSHLLTSRPHAGSPQPAHSTDGGRARTAAHTHAHARSRATAAAEQQSSRSASRQGSN